MGKLAGMMVAGLGMLIAASPALAAPDAESLAIGRCSVVDDVSVYSRSASMFPALQTFTISTDVKKGLPLPALMVDGWKPGPGSLEKVLGDLGAEAGFSVAGSGFPRVTWTGKTASLSQAVNELSRQAGADWSFDGSVLTLSKPKPASPLVSTASVMLPQSRDARLAFLDIVRGHGLDVKVDGGRAALSGTSAAFAKAATALAGTSQLVVFDVAFLRGRPADGRYNWAGFGASETSVSNAGGRFAFSSMSMNDVVSALRTRGDLQLDGMQTVAAPQGWSLAVPQAQCGSGSAELVIKPKFTGDVLALGLQGAGISAQYSNFALGSVALVASSQPVNGWIQMAVVRPRIVAFKR